MNEQPLPHWDPGWAKVRTKPWTVRLKQQLHSHDELDCLDCKAIAMKWFAKQGAEAMDRADAVAAAHAEHVLTCKACAAQNEAHDVRLDQLRRKARKWKRRYLKAKLAERNVCLYTLVTDGSVFVCRLPLLHEGPHAVPEAGEGAKGKPPR